MAKHESHFTCDICGRSFPSGTDVRGSVSLYSSHGSVIFGDVCDPCIPKVEHLILKFPKANPLRREHEPSIPPPVRTSQQLAQDEEDAIQRAREEGRL